MTYFFNIYKYVDIFIIVFSLPYYCNIRYVVLSFDEIKTRLIIYTYLLRPYSSLNRTKVSNFSDIYFNSKQFHALTNARSMLAIYNCTCIFLEMPKSVSLTSPSLVIKTLAPRR